VKVVVPRNAIKWQCAGYAVGFLCWGKSGGSGLVSYYQTVLYLCLNLPKLNCQNRPLYLCL